MLEWTSSDEDCGFNMKYVYLHECSPIKNIGVYIPLPTHTQMGGERLISN